MAYIDDLQKTDFYYVSISKVYEYYINILNTIVDDDYFDYFHEVYYGYFTEENEKQLLIYIPEILFFDQLSFEKGFYKKSDKDLYKKEVDFHKSVWEASIHKNIYNEYIKFCEKYNIDK